MKSKLTKNKHQIRKGKNGKTPNPIPDINNDKDSTSLDKMTPNNEMGPVESNRNHPEWVGKNELLNRTLGKVNFSEYKGTANHLILQATVYDGSHIRVDDRQTYHVYNRFPGIMIHDFAPMFGALNTSGNDAEEMARIIYATIRRTISGRRNYDSTTVLQYILAVGSLQSAFGELHRVLAAVRNRSMINRYFGERLTEALGYDYDDIVANYNKYAFAMNQVALTAETLGIPRGLDLFNRWYLMNSSVFSDSEDPRSGLYAFVSHGFWVWRNLKQVTNIRWEDVKAEIDRNHAPNLGTSQTSASLTPGDQINLGEFAPYGLVFEYWPAYHTHTQRDDSPSRFEVILSTLRRAAFEYIDNHDFNLVAADLRKAYGDNVITVPQFVPDATLNITHSPTFNAACKNITYVPFYPLAALEFPVQAWESRGHRNGVVYVMRATLRDSHVIQNAATKQRNSTISRRSIFTVPQSSYVFSKSEDLDEKQTMNMLKWQVRYRLSAPDAGNVILYRPSDDPLHLNPGQKIGINIEAMGTEIITSSRIFGIVDNLRGLGDNNSEEAFTALTKHLTTYGQLFHYFGTTNYINLPRYYVPFHDHGKATLDGEPLHKKEYNSLVIPHETLAYLAWARHWDSAPAMYLIIEAGILRERSSEKLSHWNDLMALNPWPHYAVLDGNTIRRHHEVALASLLDLGSWGNGSINNEQSGPSQSLIQTGIKS